MGRKRPAAETVAPSATGHAAEAVLLLAIVTCPTLIIPFADNPFEPHKAAFLWVVVGAVCLAIVGSPAVWRERVRIFRDWRLVLVVLAGAAVAAMLVSTARSDAPALAWWGSTLRRYGTLTEIALLVVMCAVLMLSRDDETIERLTVAIVAGSVSPTVYAIYQAVGVDPVVWNVSMGRASSTFGNPLFLAGYLATVWPVTLGYAVVRTARLKANRRRAHIESLWALVALQLVVFVSARSRGPALALVAASAVGGIALLAIGRYRRLAVALAGAIAVVSMLFLFLGPARMHVTATPFGSGDAPERSDNTAAVRLVLWDAIGRGVRANMNRLTFGSGPESTTALLTRYAGPELPWLEGSNTAPDRAHNETLETLASFGLVGLMIRLAIAGVALAAFLTALGLVDRAHAGAFLMFEAGVFAAAGAAAIWSGAGLWALAVAPPAAVIIIIGGWIACRSRGVIDVRPEIVVIVVATTTAWTAHFIEGQLGVLTVGSSLSAAVAIAIGVALAAQVADANVSVRRPASRGSGLSGAAMGILVGWSTAVLTIGLAGPQFAAGTGLWLIAGTAWLLSVGVAGIDARGAVASAATWLVVTAVWLWWRGVPNGAETVPAVALALIDRIPLFYVAAGGCLVLMTRSLTNISGRARHWAISATLGLLGGTAVALFSIRLTGADILARAAVLRVSERDYASAVVLYRATVERDRSNDEALTHLADALMMQADAIAERGARNALLSQAGEALAHAQAANPFQYHHPRNLAALQRRWARGLSREERDPHLAEADRLYQLTMNLAPANGVIWAEWGNLEAERRKPLEALTKLDHAAALGAVLETTAVADVLLRAEGEDVTRPGVPARLALDLKRRGYPALAALYAHRAAAER